MRDRLIRLIAEANQKSIEAKPWTPRQAIEIIADTLLANGVIVPPCKVGDTVYRIRQLYSGEITIVEGFVLEVAIMHEEFQRDNQKNEYRFYFWAKPDKTHTSREYSLWCEFTDFGKTVFLTQEEAEKALERSGE